MTTLLQLGHRLRDVRLASGQFKKTLAESSGINRNTLHSLESGIGNVELNTLLAVCDSLGLDVLLVPRETADKHRALAPSAMSTPAGSFITRAIEARAGGRAGKEGGSGAGKSLTPASKALPTSELPEDDSQ